MMKRMRAGGVGAVAVRSAYLRFQPGRVSHNSFDRIKE
jgi:hypothetical protein